MIPDPLETVLFDMDGLLVNTEAICRDAMLSEAKARGRPMPLDVFLQMIGLPGHASDDLARRHFGSDFDLPDYNDHVARRMHERLQAEDVLKDGVVELLDLLDDKAIRRAIVTSSSHASVEAHLSRSGIIPRFDAIIARGDYVRGKPHPDPYLRAAAVLNSDPSRCLVLEDSYNGVRAAHAAGMATIMVPDLLAPTEEMHALCSAVAGTLHEVHASISRAKVASAAARDGRAGRPE